jgi:hypothetical protein
MLEALREGSDMFNRIKCVALCGLALFCLEGCSTLSSRKWAGGSDSAVAQNDNQIPMYTNKGTVVSPSSAGR